MKALLLVDQVVSDKISVVKERLYKKGFRIDGKFVPDSVPHITLAKVREIKEARIPDLEQRLDQIFKNYKTEHISNFRIVNERQSSDSNWIALSIDENWLRDLSAEIEKTLESLGINQTLEYKKGIYNLRTTRNPEEKIKIENCIADHLNLLNKCKIEFADKA